MSRPVHPDLFVAIARRTAELLAPPPARLTDRDGIAGQLEVPAPWVLAEHARTHPASRLGRYARFDPECVNASWREHMCTPAAGSLHDR